MPELCHASELQPVWRSTLLQVLWGSDAVPIFKVENKEPQYLTANEQGLCLSECNYPDLWPWGSWGSDKKSLGRVLSCQIQNMHRHELLLLSLFLLYFFLFFFFFPTEKALWGLCLLSFLGSTLNKITFTSFFWQGLGHFWVPLWWTAGSCSVLVSPMVVCSWQNFMVQYTHIPSSH